MPAARAVHRLLLPTRREREHLVVQLAHRLLGLRVALEQTLRVARLGQIEGAIAAARRRRHVRWHVLPQRLEEDTDGHRLVRALARLAAPLVVLEEMVEGPLAEEVSQSLLPQQPGLHVFGTHQICHEPRAHRAKQLLRARSGWK